MTASDAYFEYLLTRSRRALWYRRLWLYPRLCRYLHGRVLDVGCGIGDLLRYRRDTVGVDINPASVEGCRRQRLDAKLMTADRLPFAAAEFDGAVLDNVLEHITDPDPLLSDLRRVLVPGATVVVGVPGRRGFASDPDHKVFYDRSRLIRVMQGNRYTVQRTFGMPLTASWLDQRLRQYCVYGVFRRDA